jgi:periplasmic divalent cation tolerance protein
MSPYPLDPVEARGPMRLVLTNYPSRDAARTAVDGALAGRLAACANLVPIDSRYWWKGRVESAAETLVLFKTVPKRVGALFRFLQETHPYDVPEILEVDVPRVDAEYLSYLAATLDRNAPPPPLGGGSTRPAGRRGPAARAPGRTRAPHRRRSR